MATESLGPTIIGVTMLFWVLAFVALGLRFWSLQIRRRGIFAHDVLVLLGFIFATALTVCLIVSVESAGLGRHAIELLSTPWKLVTFGKLLIAIQILWCASMTTVRLSILSLYVQLFSSSKSFRVACYVFMTICLLWAAGEVLVVFLLCRPFQFNWDKTVEGSCGNLNAAYLIVHGSNFVIDSSIALLPTPVLWGLKLATPKKLGIMVMFALGALICSIAIARIALYQLALGYDQTDFTYTGSTLYLFTSMEPLLACTLACMPMLQPVADMTTNSSVVSWAKSLVRTSRSGTQASSSGRQPSSGRQLGYLPTDSQEGLHHVAYVTANKEWTGSGAPERGIYVNHHLEQSSFEMVDKQSGGR
ncbi:hypothetical protein C8A00DRAFT_12914 [Chaetomidium leptoderma]|uniref:Rhodopsin domain-containing protein n=1 Tax=Chaetomidium leptoderma TaxID=669021 RepID=A0AAN6VTE5_9PEZI|nr:hypothetical protein C8A00DRAFT_12914 [Chaetomidium leptoderma]